MCFQFRFSNLEAHSSEIFSIAVASTRAITASGESSIKIWDTKSQDHPLIHTFINAHSLGAHHVVVDVDNGGSTAASSGFGQELVVWDLTEGREKARLDPSGWCFSYFD
jgi:superkiller protein 8